MQWEVVAHGYGLAEAPTVAPDGSILFSDVLRGGIYRVTTGGDVHTVVPKRRGVGGIALHARGGIVCSGRDIVHIERHQRVEHHSIMQELPWQNRPLAPRRMRLRQRFNKIVFK